MDFENTSVEAMERVNSYPLMPSERGVYLEQRIHPDSVSYNMNIGIRIESARDTFLTEEKIEAALKRVFMRHEALHSVYGEIEGVPSRILVGEDALPKLQIGIETTWDEFMRSIEKCGEAFSLNRQIPVRIKLHPLTEGGFALHMEIHHVAFDGGSARPFLQELLSELAGKEVLMSGADLSEIQSRKAKDSPAALSFYEKMFEDGVPENKMPLKGIRPKAQPLSESIASSCLAFDEMEKLDQKAKAYGVTTFEALLSLAAITLGKYCSSEDMIIGVPVNTRDRYAADCIGMFVEYVPVRLRPVLKEELSRYLLEARNTLRGARENLVPFELLVNRFCDRAESSRPLFDFSVNYFHEPGLISEDGIQIFSAASLQSVSRDLSLTIRRYSDRMKLFLQYSSELFNSVVCENFLEQFIESIRLFISSDPKKVRDLAALPVEQLRQINSFSASKSSEIPEELLHLMFEKTAAQNPERTAVIASDKIINFDELNRSANAVAHGLIKSGIGRGDRVMLLLPRRSFYFAALFGVLKAGAAFIPTDPAYPIERLISIAEDSEAAIIITSKEVSLREGAFPKERLQTIEALLIEERDGAPEASSGRLRIENPDIPLSGNDLAYMIYTSGSTGKPKGVMLTHRGISNFCNAHPANILYGGTLELDAMLSITTVAFDLGLKDSVGMLVNGKSVVFADEKEMNNPKALAGLMETHHVDAINATPSRLLTYLEHPAFRKAISNCRLVMAGGEPYPEKLLRELREVTEATLINTYGPTETTISANMADLTKADRVTVGRPLLNVREYIVDCENSETPIGVRGELLIGGPGVARGYQGLPELNSRKFISFKGERFFRTGDFAKWDEDGNIVILGRADDQVKLRGLRIELGEIEAILNRQTGVTGSAAAVRTIDGAEHLLAWYTSDSILDEYDLRASLRSELTEYMAPDFITRVKEIPLSLNGKKNVRALPTPAPKIEKENESRADRPLTIFERDIMDVLSEVLKIKNISSSQSLLSAGLTSLSAVSLAVKIEERWGSDIPVGKLLSGISIFDLENIIYEEMRAGSFALNHEKASIIGSGITEAPLTPWQQGIYLDAMKRPEEIRYNMPLYLSFKDIDPNRLASALRAAISCHLVLSSKVKLEASGAKLIFDEKVPEIQVKETGSKELKERLSSFVRPFDLNNGPLVRFEILYDSKAVYLLWDTHHLIFDGVSRAIFLQSLEKAYKGEAAQRESFTYFDYALRQDRENSENSASYFEEMLSDFEAPTEIQPDIAGSSGETGRLKSISIEIENEAIVDFCRRNGITPAGFFLAASGYAVARFAGVKKAFISTISAGRNESEIRRTVGMFVRTLPIAVGIDAGADALSFVKSGAEALQSSISHEDFPFTEIAAKYGYAADIMYECQIGMRDGMRELAGHPYIVTPLELDRPKFKVAIVLEDAKEQDSYLITVRYNDALYSEKYMRSLAESVRNAAEFIVRCPEEMANRISLLDDDGKKTIQSFERSAEAEVPERLLNKVFEKQANKRPMDTALIASDRTFSYHELDCEANEVALNLIRLGVKRGDSIVLLLPRRSFYISAMLGVLKAGAAFIPCDPEYPEDRIKHIQMDSGAAFIVTTGANKTNYPAEKTIDIEILLGKPWEERPEVHWGQDPSDLAYMIYTSGSTGKPKGVELTHGGITNYLYPHPANTLFYILEKEVHAVLSVTTVSFDMSLKEILGALANGKTLVFASEECANDPKALAELMLETGADCFNATPSKLMQYMEYEPFRMALRGCRLVMCGGESYPLALRDRLREVTKAHILNTYGPTEITVSSNACEITDTNLVSVGRPLLNYAEYIVDSDGNLLPPGCIGELLIGGAGVAKGYHNLPDLTREKFIEFNGVRCFKSGDNARWDDSGNILILGRMDDQVKLRGLRIELNEIEELLSTLPHIRQALVLIKEIGGQENLCAYFTADEPDLPIEELKNALKKKLTAYMIPSAWLQLDSFPVTANGKLDKKALPDPVLSDPGSYEEPTNEAEEYFCSLFQKILKTDRVGINDSFFELGGTSLLVMSVVMEAESKGYRIVYSDLFKHSSPRELAANFGGEKAKALLIAPGKERPVLIDFDDYDYSGIDSLLNENLDTYLKRKKREIGNILLTGATGFMGIHLLAEFLRCEKGKAYCLVRRGRYKDAKDRLRNMMFYYFEDSLTEAFETRVEAMDGDVTRYECFEALEKAPIDTVFNCAANVKHFSNGTDIEDINVGGARNCIRFATRRGARLIHFSTTSVAGLSVNERVPKEKALDERSLYFGQRLDTKYTNSKLWAEREIFEAMVREGLDAKVIRVGTLAPRVRDSEFQVNFRTNSFMGRLRSFALLKRFPYELNDFSIQMGPIDESAAAFLKLARLPKSNCLFHAVNNHTVPLGDIIREMNDCGMDIEFVENEDFNLALSEAGKDPRKAAVLASMLAYKRLQDRDLVENVPVRHEFTIQALLREGFFWQSTDRSYIRGFIRALSGLGFF